MRLAAGIILASASLALCACEFLGYNSDKDLPELAEGVEIQTLNAAELSELLDTGSVRLIDVRSDAEVAEGVIPGAEHIPIDTFDPSKLDFSDGRTVIPYCHSGGRSERAARMLAAHTQQSVRHLEGGIVAWRNAQLPLATAE